MNAAPTRRGALRSTVAAIAAGLAVANVATAAPDADAELIAAVSDMARHHAWIEAYNALPAETPDSPDDLDVALKGFWRAADRVIALPATTPGGTRAKASALRMVIQNMITGPEHPITEAEFHEQLAYGLASDILAGEYWGMNVVAPAETGILVTDPATLEFLDMVRSMTGDQRTAFSAFMQETAAGRATPDTAFRLGKAMGHSDGAASALARHWSDLESQPAGDVA